MAKGVLSPAYKAAAKGLVYDFQLSSGANESDWTPHNVKAVIIAREGIKAKGYYSKLPVSKSALISFRPLDKVVDVPEKELYKDLFKVFYDLNKDKSANISNLQDIVVFLGGEDGLPYPNSEIAGQYLGLEGLRAKAQREGFSMPNIIFVDGTKTRVSKLEGIIDIGKRRLLSSVEPSFKGKDKITLRRIDKGKGWIIFDEKLSISKDLLSDFIIDSNSKEKFYNIISIASALRFSDIKDACDIKFSKFNIQEDFTTNTGHYPVDEKLLSYMVENYFKPACAWQYFLEQAQGMESILKVKKECRRAIEALEATAQCTGYCKDYCTAKLLANIVGNMANRDVIPRVNWLLRGTSASFLSSGSVIAPVTKADFDELADVFQKATVIFLECLEVIYMLGFGTPTTGQVAIKTLECIFGGMKIDLYGINDVAQIVSKVVKVPKLSPEDKNKAIQIVLHGSWYNTGSSDIDFEGHKKFFDLIRGGK